MTFDLHSYEPRNGHGLRHDPFNAIIGPRPIGWISSKDGAGKVNLAPYSFFNAFNYVPPILAFGSITRKHTLANVSEHGEFVWNLATKDLAQKMNATAAHVGAGVDEFDVAGLTKVASSVVDVPRIGEARVAFECKVTQIVQLKTAAGNDVESWVTFGEVVAVHIDKTLIKDGVYQTAWAGPILRAGRKGDYFEIHEENMFEMTRPD